MRSGVRGDKCAVRMGDSVRKRFTAHHTLGRLDRFKRQRWSTFAVKRVRPSFRAVPDDLGRLSAAVLPQRLALEGSFSIPGRLHP